MELFYNLDSDQVKNIIEKTISSYGFSAEHNHNYIMSYASKECKPIFAYFGDDKGLFGLEWDDGFWQLISEVMSPMNERAALFSEFCRYIFSDKNAKKILLEVPPIFRKELLKDNTKLLPELKIGAITKKLYTPIISLEEWNSTLYGPGYSSLRKAKNRFFRLFNIKILKGKDVNHISIVEYTKMVDAWRKNRSPNDIASYDDYLSYIKNGFKGSDAQLALIINDKLCGLSVAWRLPNNHDTIYYGINLHDYSIPELGEFLAVIFFEMLKSQGYKHLDFGSSDEGLLNYKKKFHPKSIIDYVCFYIRK